VNAIFLQIVPRENLTKVQGVNQTLNSLLMLFAPAVGGLILGSMGIAWALMLDVVTAAFAVIILCFIHVEKVKRTDTLFPLFTELKQGIDYTFRHPLLRGIIICYALSFFLITPAAVLTPLLIERSFGNDVWRLTVNEMVWTVGSLIGGVFVSLHGDFKDKVRTIAVCLMAHGITFCLLGIAGNFTIYLIIMGIGGFFMPIIATAETVFIQEITQQDKLGRVFSIVQIISASAMPVAILFFGPLADIISVEIILVLTGILLALVGLMYYNIQKNIKI